MDFVIQPKSELVNQCKLFPSSSKHKPWQRLADALLYQSIRLCLCLAFLLSNQTYATASDMIPQVELTLIAGSIERDDDFIINAGDDVVYHYILHNTGTTDLNVNSIQDDVFGNILKDGRLKGGDTNRDNILNTNEIWTYTYTAKNLTHNITNTATVKTNPVDEFGSDLNDFVTITAQDATKVIVYEASILIVTTVGNAADGETLSITNNEAVTYTYDIYNNGKTALGSLTLLDNPHGSIMVNGVQFNGTFESGDIDGDKILDVDEHWVFTLIVENIKSDVTSIGIVSANPVYANGRDIPGLGNPSDSDMARVKIVEPGTVSGSVLADTTGDRQGDVGMSGVEVSVKDANDHTQVMHTNQDGFYSFSIPVGKFSIYETDPEGYSSLSDAQGKNNNKIEGEIELGQAIDQLDFIDAQNASIAGSVMMDSDANGIADMAVSSATVYIVDQEDNRQSMPTEKDGSFSFTIMPGDFTIIQKDLDDYKSISDIDGANDNIISGRTKPGEVLSGQDFLDAFKKLDCDFGNPALRVTDNDCPSNQSGLIELVSDCGPGIFTEFSIDNGVSWTQTLPTYDPANSITVLARCIEEDPQCVEELFDFESLAPSDDPVTDITNAGLTANGITLTSLTVTNFGTATQDDFEINDDHLAGTFGPKLGVENGDSIQNNQTATFTFSAPVSDLCILVNDLDQNDAAVINGSLAGAAPIQLTAADYSFPFGAGACPEFQGNNTFESQCFNGAGNVSNSLQGGVVVCFPTPIDQIDIQFYDWGDTGGGSYTLSTFAVCVPQEACISDTISVTTMPEICCTQPAPPTIGVIDSTCDPLQAGEFTVITDCQNGTTLEYSTDNGANWTPQMPAYPSSGNVIARCVDTSLAGCVSANSTPVTSNPEVCTGCISLVKSSELDLGADGIATVGDIITYTYEITNCGDVQISSLELLEFESEFSGSGIIPSPSEIPAILEVGGSVTATAEYEITQEDIDNGGVKNQAITNGRDPNSNPLTDRSDSNNPLDGNGPDDPTFTIIPTNPCVELIKSSELTVSQTGIAAPGDEIIYTYEVINCGNVTLSNINIAESNSLFTGSNALPVPGAVNPATIGPGESAFATATYIISGEDIAQGGVENQATVTAEDPNLDEVSDISDSGNPTDQGSGPNDPTTTPIPSNPCIEIIKSSELITGPDNMATEGDIVIYTYTVRNCGNVVLTDVTVSELQSMFSGTGALPVPSIVNPLSLAPDQVGTASASYTLTQQDIDNGGVTNQAIAIGNDPGGMAITDDSDSGNPLDQDLGSDDPTGTPLLAEPCISITKSSSINTGADGIANPGDVITYNYVITNCGNLTLRNVAVTETIGMFTGNGNLPVPSVPSPRVIAPGESTTSTASYIITQEDINQGGVENQALVSSIGPSGEDVTDLSDSDNPMDEDNGPDDPTTTTLDFEPCVELIKVSDLDLGSDNEASPGDIISYSYEITNCGNVRIDNISIEELDALFTGSNGAPVPSAINPLSLDPGQTGSGSASYSISQIDIDQGFVNNQALAIAMDPDGEEVTDISDSGNPIDDGDGPEDPTVTIIPVNPCIELIKSSSLAVGPDGIATPGDEITYTYFMRNCGNVTLTGLSVLESVSQFTGGGNLPVPSAVNPQILIPGASATATAVYAITQEDINAGVISNTAIANGLDPMGNDVTDESDSDNPADDSGGPDDPTTTMIPQVPCIDLIKSSVFVIGLDSRANPGDDIIYEYEIRNCGNVALSNVEVIESIEDFTGTNGFPQINNEAGLTLVPGQIETLNATYSISQEDIDAGAVTNQALATGDSPDGNDVTDSSDSGNPLDETGAPDDPTNTPIPADPCVRLIKSSTVDLGSNHRANPGDVIEYIYVVRNCGELSLNNIVITETPASFSGTGILPQVSAVSPETILPGEEGEAFAFYALTQMDIDSGLVVNQAFVTADPPYGDSVTDISDSGNPFDNNGPEDPTSTPVGNCEILACNINVQISIDASCHIVVTPDMLLENPDMFGAYEIEFYNNDGEYLRNDTLFVSDVGEDINYKIYCGGNSCWGTITLEANLIPEIPAPCACTESGEIPESCKYWCGMGVPESIISPEEALQIYEGCGPKLLGEMIVTESKTGDLCSAEGEVIELRYTGKVLIHGALEEIDILCQRYSIEKLDIDLSESEFNERFGFPRNVVLDCNYLDDIQSEEAYDVGSPESIFAFTGSGSLAYTYYVDQHQLVDLIKIDTTISHVEVDTVHRSDFIQQDIDGDGLKEWILVTIVDKIYAEQEVYDTTYLGKAHPEIPIVERVCNLQTAFSDLEFELCGGGLKIVRDWAVIDWCDSSIRRTGSQTIYIQDNKAPVIYNEAGDPVTDLDDVYAIIDPWECISNVKLPELTMVDDCTTELDVEWHVHDHDIVDGYIIGLTPAQSPMVIEGTIKDDCGNERAINFTAIVKDDVPPSMVCEEKAQVVLVNDPNTGTASVKALASHFDAGSHDLSCGEVTLTVVREEDWVEQITNCEGDRVGYRPVSCHAQTDTLAFSSKECGDEKVLISKPGAYAKFCCEDIGKELYVILIATDASGNKNSCRIPVQVFNKTAPLMKCEDQLVDCSAGEELTIPTMMVEECQSDNYQIELLNETASEGVCSGGTIVREWYIDVDGSGDYNTGDTYCLQRLLLEGGNAFDPYTIKWPKSFDGSVEVGVDVSCDENGNVVEDRAPVYMGEPLLCNPENTQFMPSWCESSCNLVGYSMQTDTVNVDFACSKIIRSWRIIDWCTYDVNQEEDNVGDRIEAVDASEGRDCAACENKDIPYDDVYFRYENVTIDGYYSYEQVIYVDDDTAPTLDVVESISVETDSGDPNKEEVSDCIGEAVLSASASDFCGGSVTSTSQLHWTISVFQDSIELSSTSSTGALAEINISGRAGESKTVLWSIRDACDNTTEKSTAVHFIDTEAPTPVCLFGVTTSYAVEDGIAEVWASDINFGSFDNCTAIHDLVYTIVQDGTAPLRPGDPGFEEQARIQFSCEDFTSFSELNLWVWDTDGNGAFCTAVIGINGTACDVEGPADMDSTMVDTMVVDTMLVDTIDTQVNSIIAGDVYTEAGLAINGVQVTISAPSNEYPKSWTTFDEGHYAFDSNPNGLNYSIEAQRDDEPLNGVSTIDLVLMSRHIIGQSQFASPYQIIAADANGDGRVSAVDIVEMKRLILGLNTDFTGLDSWMFIPADQSFVDPISPWPFTQEIEIVALDAHRIQEDFIGVKIGDVNASAAANNSHQVEIRSSGVLKLNATNELMTKGQTSLIEITANHFKDVYGMQFSLAHSGLSIKDIIPGSLELDIESIHATESKTNFVWFEPLGQSVSNDEVLFYLEVEANEDLSIKDVLQIHSDPVRSEAYIGDYFDQYSVALEVTPNVSDFDAYQNQPNPFSEITQIPFELSKFGTVFVKIYTSQGQLIWSHTQEYEPGRHELPVTSNEIQTEGILIYTVSDGSTTVTHQMLRVKT